MIQKFLCFATGWALRISLVTITRSRSAIWALIPRWKVEKRLPRRNGKQTSLMEPGKQRSMLVAAETSLVNITILGSIHCFQRISKSKNVWIFVARWMFGFQNPLVVKIGFELKEAFLDRLRNVLQNTIFVAHIIIHMLGVMAIKFDSLRIFLCLFRIRGLMGGWADIRTLFGFWNPLEKMDAPLSWIIMKKEAILRDVNVLVLCHFLCKIT